MKILILFAILALASLAGFGCSSEHLPINDKINSSIEDHDLIANAVSEYIEEIEYTVALNSAAGLWIVLPHSFGEDICESEIGSFLNERNELSKINGFDFSDYLGKEVYLYTCSSEWDDDLILLVYQGTIIGAWKDSTRKDFHFIRFNMELPDSKES